MDYKKYIENYRGFASIVSFSTMLIFYHNYKLFLASLSVYILTAFAMVFLAKPILKQFKIPKRYTDIKSIVHNISFVTLSINNKRSIWSALFIAFFIEGLLYTSVTHLIGVYV